MKRGAEFHPLKDTIVSSNYLPPEALREKMRRGGWVDANALFKTLPGDRAEKSFQEIFNDTQTYIPLETSATEQETGIKNAGFTEVQKDILISMSQGLHKQNIMRGLEISSEAQYQGEMYEIKANGRRLAMQETPHPKDLDSLFYAISYSIKNGIIGEADLPGEIPGDLPTEILGKLGEGYSYDTIRKTFGEKPRKFASQILGLKHALQAKSDHHLVAIAATLQKLSRE